ncbi:glycosyltransferase family 4 protein [Dankookia sp. GCM10030260]|uniref:glycosyltransferase family 4 protein n=1 Tax=Dankookia sp. GCM10030260 TaxID=3273390 RepID=UPI00361447A3
MPQDGGASGVAKRRILASIVVPPHMSVSGGARAAEQLSAAVSSQCDVTVASMMNGAAAIPSAESQGPVHRIMVRSWRPPLLPWSRLPSRYSTLFYRSDLPAIIGRGGYDLVHLHNPMPALEFERVAKACRATGTPYVISTHGFNEVANGARIYGFDRLRSLAWQQLVVAPVTRAVRRAAAIFALSPSDISIVRGMGYDGPIEIVGNGVPLPAPASLAADRAVLERLGIPVERDSSEISCMFLANHTPNKGLPDLLQAFSRLRCPYLLVVGGQQRDGIDYERYSRACLPGQRIVVVGRVTDREVAALFRRADLFVFPTLADTFPLVVLEAMSHGVPVLASSVGGIPYQVDENCGVLVPPGDPAALADAVQMLARDRARLVGMGDHARARVVREFSWARAAEQAVAGYGRVLGGHGATPPRSSVSPELPDVD